jgi:hypothetical protein
MHFNHAGTLLMLSETRCAEKARRCKCPLLLSRQLTPDQHDGVKNCTRGVVAVFFVGLCPVP